MITIKKGLQTASIEPVAGETVNSLLDRAAGLFLIDRDSVQVVLNGETLNRETEVLDGTTVNLLDRINVKG